LITFNHINLGDFFERYREIEGGSVDLFLSDLPYNLFDDQRLSGLPNDQPLDLERLEGALDYLLTPTGQAVVFCDFDLLTRIKSEFGRYLTFKHFHVLAKSMAMPGNKFYPLNDCEFLAVCYRSGSKISDLTFNPFNGDRGEPYSKKNYDLNGCKIRHQHKPLKNVNYDGRRHIKTIIPMQSKCNLPAAERAGVDHPFQKSLKLCRQLVRTYSNPGDFVLDGFAGSASTLIAAETEKRRYCGFEIDERFYLEGLSRLERFKCQETLPF